MIVILPACQREIRKFPEEIREDLADALARLDAGQSLTMPLSRPMPTIRHGVHELRLKDRSGAYRVIYALIEQGMVYGLHAFKKTTRKTPLRHIALASRRLKEILA